MTHLATVNQDMNLAMFEAIVAAPDLDIILTKWFLLVPISSAIQFVVKVWKCSLLFLSA